MQDFEKIRIDPEDEDDTNLLHYLLTILKWKKMVAGITLGCTLLTAAISFMMPPKYQAETRILPPQLALRPACRRRPAGKRAPHRTTASRRD